MKPSDFIDQMMEQKQMTASWAFWDLEAPTEADIEDSKIPSRSPSEGSKRASGDIATPTQMQQVVEAQEALSADVWELKQSIDFLTKIIAGK